MDGCVLYSLQSPHCLLSTKYLFCPIGFALLDASFLQAANGVGYAKHCGQGSHIHILLSTASIISLKSLLIYILLNNLCFI